MAGLMPDGRPRSQSPPTPQQQYLHPNASPPSRPLLLPRPSSPLPRAASPRLTPAHTSSSSSDGYLAMPGLSPGISPQGLSPSSPGPVARRPLQRQQPVDSSESLVGKLIVDEGLQRYVSPTFLRRELQESLEMTDDEMEKAAQELLISPTPHHPAYRPPFRSPVLQPPPRSPLIRPRNPVSPVLRSASSPTPDQASQPVQNTLVPNLRSNSTPDPGSEPTDSTLIHCELMGGFAAHEIKDFNKYSSKDSEKSLSKGSETPPNTGSTQCIVDSDDNVVYVTTL